MELGTVTKYKVGYNKNGIVITRVFPEFVIKNHIQNRYTYNSAFYYILYDRNRGVGPEPFILAEYELNNLINMLEHGVICYAKQLLTSIVTKHKPHKVRIYSVKSRKMSMFSK